MLAGGWTSSDSGSVSKTLETADRPALQSAITDAHGKIGTIALKAKIQLGRIYLQTLGISSTKGNGELCPLK